MADQDRGSPNPMQMQLGLVGGGGSFNPVGIPTPQPQMPYVPSPGETSQNVVNQTQTQAMRTIQSAQMVSPTPVGSFSPYPTFPAAGGGGMGAMGGFAQAYQQNMGQINSQLIGSPFYAQMMSRMGGMGPGFQGGMMPSPTQMTDPSMGLYRPFPQASAGVIPPVPQMPLIRHPVVPSFPSPRFQTPYEFSYNTAQQRADQYTSAAMAAPSIGARLGVDAYGASLMGGLGAAAGAMIGGPAGARLGGMLGGIAGLAGTEGLGIGRGMQGIVNTLNPMNSLMSRGAQMQGMSQDWVVGGDSLSMMGRGFGRSASLSAGRMIEDLGYNSNFKRQTANAFSVQDLTRITQSAGQAGLLDFAQSPEAMRDDVSKLAKQLRTFMQIANEPNVREAVRQMGQLRAMGVDTADMSGFAMNSRTFARMAGTTVRGLAETAGLPGAMMAQQMGFSAGMGMQMGQGMYGMAKQAIAGGAFTTQDIAMFGGAQGIAQRNTESALATLKIPLLAASMSQLLPSGKAFGLNTSMIESVMSGKTGIEGMARAGVQNLHNAVAQQGVGALGTFMMQQGELQDQLGRVLGPTGLKTMQFRNVLDAQKTLGFDKSAGGLFMAAKSIGMDDLQAKQIVKEANSPGFFKGMQQQLDVQIKEMRAQTKDVNDREYNGVFRRAGRNYEAAHEFGMGLSTMGRGVRNGLERAGQFVSEMGEDWSLGEGENIIRTPKQLQYKNDREMRGLAQRYENNRISGDNGRYGNLSSAPRVGLVNLGGREHGQGAVANAMYGISGDRDEIREFYRRRGGSNETFAFADKALRWMGAPVVSSKDAADSNAASDAVSTEISEARNQTGSETMTAYDALKAKMGSGTSAYLAKVQEAMVAEADATRGGSEKNWANGNGAKIGGEYYSRVEKRMIAAGATAAQLAEFKNNRGGTLKAQGIVALSGVNHAGEEAALLGSGDQSRNALNRDATQMGLENADEANRAIYGGGADQQSMETLSSVAAIPLTREAAVFSAVAMSKLPGDAGKQGKALLIKMRENDKDYSPENLEKWTRSAGERYSKMDETERDRYGAGAARLADSVGGDLGKFEGRLKDTLGKAAYGKVHTTLGRGLQELMPLEMNNDIIKQFNSGTGGLATVLDSAAGRLDSEGHLKGAQRGMENLAQEWKSAGNDPVKREAVMKKLTSNALSQGSAVEKKIGGTGRDPRELAVRNANGDLASVQSELAGSFPAAVGTFKEASTMLLEAAKRFGGGMGTMYGAEGG